MWIPFTGALAVALAAALAAGTAAPAPSDMPELGRATLDVSADGDSMVVVAGFASLDEAPAVSLRYTLAVSKTGRSRSTSRQSGRFMPVPGGTTTLATSRISAPAGDAVEVVLTVSGADGVLDVARFHTAATP